LRLRFRSLRSYEGVPVLASPIHCGRSGGPRQ
jgi:hypothetical protein